MSQGPLSQFVAGLFVWLGVASGAQGGDLILETRSADPGQHPNHTLVPGNAAVKGPMKKSPSRGFHLWLDREEYDPRDVTAVCLVGIEALNIPPAQAAVLLRVLKGSREVVAERIARLAGIRTAVVLDLQRLPLGEYTLTADLMRGEERVATDSRPFRKVERKMLARGAASGRIPIRVWAAPQAKGVQWPISTGVPFAQSVLSSDDRVSLLDPNGREVVCQTSVRSTWNARGSIQWLGLDFIPTLSDRVQEYTLVYGLEKPRPPRPSRWAPQVRCEEGKEAIRVDTGPLQFVASRRRIIEEASLGKEQILKAGSGAGLSLVDHEGNRYEAAEDRNAEVVVEEKGPVKVVIRITGWYVKQGTRGQRLSCELPTDRLCKFCVRLTAYAGQPILRVAVTTVLTCDSTRVRLRDLAIGLTPTDAQSVRIGTNKKTPLTWDKGRLKKNPFLVQDRWDTSFDDVRKDQGRVAGWVEVAGNKADLVIGVRNFWKLFPKEIEWRDGTLLLHPWPAHAQQRTFNRDDELAMHNIYKLWYAHQGKELDFRFPAHYTAALDAELRKSPRSFGTYYEEMAKSNAQGIAIHNDLVIGFRPAGDTRLAGKKLSFLADDDPHAIADPAYVCATGVFGPMLHVDNERFGDLERTMRGGFRSLSTRSEVNHQHGMFIHGGEHTYWNYTRQPPHAGIHRVWINGHYQIPRVAQMQYVRSGDPSYLRWLCDNLANLRDIGTCHYVSDERRFEFHNLGAMYHCKGFAPWAGDSGLAFHMSIYDFLIYDYYLTGNRRSLDVVHEWLQGLKEASPGGWATREGTTALSQMVEAFRLTWDAALLELMHRFAAPIFDRPLRKDDHPGWDWDPPFLMRWCMLTGSRKGQEASRTARAMSYGLDGCRYGLFVVQDEDTPREAAKWAEGLYRDSLQRVDQPGVYADGHTVHTWISHAYQGNRITQPL